jgi:hypothetical protein
MIENEYIPLVEQLRTKMTNNEVVWTRTSSLTQFKLFLDNYTIIIDKWFGGNTQYVKLEILNSFGEVISGIMYNANEDNFSYSDLSSFYATVESYYRQQVTSTLSGVMGEISKLGRIGKFKDEKKNRE